MVDTSTCTTHEDLVDVMQFETDMAFVDYYSAELGKLELSFEIAKEKFEVKREFYKAKIAEHERSINAYHEKQRDKKAESSGEPTFYSL